MECNASWHSLKKKHGCWFQPSSNIIPYHVIHVQYFLLQHLDQQKYALKIIKKHRLSSFLSKIYCSFNIFAAARIRFNLDWFAAEILLRHCTLGVGAMARSPSWTNGALPWPKGFLEHHRSHGIADVSMPKKFWWFNFLSRFLVKSCY